MKKLDIMNARDGEGTWAIIDGKVQRVKKEEIKVEGPIIKETIEVVEKPKEEVKKEPKKKRKKVNYII